MRLRAWDRAWREIEFDPATGAARVVRLPAPRPESTPTAGFGHVERHVSGRRQVFALYRDDDAIIFAAGPNRWRVDDPRVRFVHRRKTPFSSHFTVWVDDARSFSIHYAHVGRMVVAIVDPTYDKLDREADFFLEFVAEYARSPDWQSNVLRQWSSSAEPR